MGVYAGASGVVEGTSAGALRRPAGSTRREASIAALRVHGARIRRPVNASPPLQDEVVEEWREIRRQKQVRLTVEQVDDLIAAYEAGSSCHDLATQFGVNESTVFAHLRRRRVERRPFRKLHGELLDRAVSLYESGRSLRSVASELGVSKESVRSALVVRGVEIRGSGRQF